MATPGGSGQGQPLSNEWQDLGLVDELKKMKCRRMWAEKGSDVALFCITEGDKERFFVTNAKCPHENGPLDQGDIEDMGNGKYKLICPIHFYTFDLDTGISETHAPMQVAVFPTETRDGHLFVKYPEVLSKKNPKKRPSRF
ncbi:hypothetical protein BaRGS_00022337 [Batillaria attramentaria]|uniref:Rieske domain-containing protein n=1 Tax=Batillaria attramentaria TaxID=370345 RepID=A0ABD0KGM9_9CAEN